MCGIIGIVAENQVAQDIYESLLMLQHRGQDAAGMVVCDVNGRLHSRKSMGYVRDVFHQRRTGDRRPVSTRGTRVRRRRRLPTMIATETESEFDRPRDPN